MAETTHIRIPKDLKPRLEALAHDGETIGAVIARLVDLGEGNGPGNRSVNLYPDGDLADRIFALEQVNGEILDRLRDLEISLSDREMRDSPIPIEVFVESSESPDGVIVEDVDDSWVPLTGEMRDQIVQAAHLLKRKGVPIQQIADAIGMPSGSLRKILSPKGNPKRVMRNQYETLMKLVHSSD